MTDYQRKVLSPFADVTAVRRSRILEFCRQLAMSSDSTISQKVLRLFPAYRRRQVRARNEKMNRGFVD